MSEEDVISLVVEGDHLSSLELRVVIEERGKHPSNRVTQSSGEIVQNHLRSMRGDSPMSLRKGKSEHIVKYYRIINRPVHYKYLYKQDIFELR